MAATLWQTSSLRMESQQIQHGGTEKSSHQTSYGVSPPPDSFICWHCEFLTLLFATEVMLKILWARLQQYVNRELPNVQVGFRKNRGMRDQIANNHWIIEKAREFQKNFCFIDYTKAFDCVDHNKLWKILKEVGIADHLTWLLRNLYAGQEAIVRARYRTTDWFQIGKGAHQGCVWSPCLFNFYAEYIMRLGWMKHKLESRLPGEISITSDVQMTPPSWQKAKRN